MICPFWAGSKLVQAGLCIHTVIASLCSQQSQTEPWEKLYLIWLTEPAPKLDKVGTGSLLTESRQHRSLTRHTGTAAAWIHYVRVMFHIIPFVPYPHKSEQILHDIPNFKIRPPPRSAESPSWVASARCSVRIYFIGSARLGHAADLSLSIGQAIPYTNQMMCSVTYLTHRESHRSQND
jgi:hypothetical protein